MSTITWGTTRNGDSVLCTVFCYVCRDVFGRDMTTREASELKGDIDERGHACGRSV